MIKLVALDMGGVVIFNHDIMPRLLGFLGRKERRLSEMDDDFISLFEAHASGLLDEEAFWRCYSSLCSVPNPYDGESLFGMFFRPAMNEGTLEIIGDLKDRGMRVVVATNVIDAHLRYHREKGQYDAFDAVYASNEMGVSKPYPAFYECIACREGVRPDEIFFADDRTDNVASARKAGLTAFLFQDADGLRKRLAELGLL